jgi:hypothetical protein
VTLYLATYRAVARNVAPSDFAAAWTAIPRDTQTETLLGLVSLADVVTIAPPFVFRSMSYTSSPGAIIPNPQLGQFLTNFYTSTFKQKLSTAIVASPIATVTVDAAPALWVRADAGAPGPLVTDWKDLSGHANDPVQATLGRQPSRAVNPVTNLVTVHFSGTDRLDTTGPLAFDAFTYLVTFGDSPGPAGFLFERGPNVAASSGENLFQSSPASLAIRRAGVTHSGNFAVNWGTDSLFHLAVERYTVADGGELLVDGALAATTTPLAPEAVSSALHLGDRLAGGFPLTGDIRELMVFPVGLSPASIASVSAYMRSQVGI